MAMFPRHNRVRYPTARRQFEWIGGVSTAFSVSTLAFGDSVIVSSFDTRGATAPAAPFTIVRVRGQLAFFSDIVAASEFPHGAFGMCVVNGEAFDAGVASIPTPFSESFDDRWLFHSYLMAPIRANANTIDQNWANITIDGKAMRKVNDGDVVVNVLENGSSAHGAQFLINLRMGVKLH